MNELPVIFCDMDGVLVDFYKGVLDLTGLNFKEYIPDHNMVDIGHNIISNTPQFWETLPPMKDYLKLWNFIKKFDPEILTARPNWDDRNVCVGKWKWILKHTPVPKDKFHCVERQDKKLYAINSITGKPNLLIDDLEKNIQEFTAAGGIGIQHISATVTILKLKKLGFY